MRLAPVFHDHAVLQRDLPLPVWGTAGAEELVTVTLAGHRAQTVSGPDGRWQVRLPPLPAGGPYELEALARSGSAVAADVLIGEVWLCSGQSNMEWTLSQVEALDAESAVAEFPDIRFLTVAAPPRIGRQEVIDGRWSRCSPRSLASFSAVGGWFARRLHRELGVPVGMICNAWGGTRIQTWMSREALMQDPLGRDEVRHYEGFAFAPDRFGPGEFASARDWEQRAAPRDAGNAGLAAGWAAAEFDDALWPHMPVPSRWQEHGHPGSGVFWFRRTFHVPADWVGDDLALNLGAVDKHDDTYVNGERVGGLSWDDGPNTWCTQRRYRIPARLVTADRRVAIAVRARSHAFHGGLIGPGIEMGLAPVGRPEAAQSLVGPWRYRCEEDWGLVTVPPMPWGAGNPNSPYILADSRVAPLVPYALRGVLWYQGESNAHEPDNYRRLLPAMIRDWRRAWGQGDFPFLQVQIANYGVPATSPAYGKWAALRDAQCAALSEPEVGMAVAIDIGDERDVHPRDKRSVGERLARWALATTYDRGGVPSGPLLASVVVEAGGVMRIRFAHGEGLRTADGGPVATVVMAGLDRVFHPATAEVDGASLRITCPQVLRPAAVRYAWADNPVGCNLINAVGLPASPFRSDAW
jgi:sialate O-acetylesterase